MDNLVFEESVNSELSQSEFVDKQWLFVNDNNNSSYSSQIVLDTTPLANSGGYINWSEAFFAIPLILQIESAAIADANFVLDWSVGLKSGFWQLLHSMTVEFNNGNIIQQVPFLNVFCSYKNLTSWSQNDIKNWGSITGFYPDSPRTWIYNNAANALANPLSANGTGLSNNRLAPYFNLDLFSAANPTSAATGANVTQSLGTTATYATSSSNYAPSQFNTGLATRIAWLNFDLGTTTGQNGTPQIAGSSNQSILLGYQGTNALTFQSYVNTQYANCRALIFDAVIRLKDIADFFQKCPLLKGSTMRIYLNTNQCYFPATVTRGSFTAATLTDPITQTGSQSLQLTGAPVILGGGATCPVMMTSADLGQGCYNLNPLATGAVNAVAVNVALSIVRTQFNQMTNVVSAPITSCRLYAPCYTMSPIAEQRFLSLTPTKKVLYNDIFQYQFSNIPSNFNLLVTNGISNVRQVVVVPFLNQTSNGVAGAGNYAGVLTSTLLSPFATSGGTPDPIQFTNFNIQVSGKNLFLQQIQYNYEMFYEQVVSSNQLNGSLTTSLSSGLVGFEDWSNLYRYYVGNVSRSLPSEDGVAKAIQILGTIPQIDQAGIAVNLMVFIVFEREITIDLRTGARVA
jgi:hypothetical protein